MESRPALLFVGLLFAALLWGGGLLLLDVGEVGVAAVVAGFVDEGAGLVEAAAGGVGLVAGQVQPGPFEMAVGLVQAHLAAPGDLLGFAEVALGSGEVALVAGEFGAGEQAAGELLLLSGLSEAIDGGAEVLFRFAEVSVARGAGRGQGGPAQGEVVETNVEQGALATSLGPPERLRRPATRLGVLALGQ